MNTKMKLAIAFCGCLIGGAAVAAPNWDSNGDGSVDAAEKTKRHEEMKAKREEMKQKFDTNKDGKLDDTERAALHDAFAAEAFKRIDTDNNGSISLAEFKAGKQFGKHGGRHMRHGFNKTR